MSNTSPKFVVRHHRPWLARLVAVVVVLALVGTGTLLYHLGRSRAGYDFTELADDRARLQARLAALEQESADLREAQRKLVRGSEVDKRAYSEVDASLRKLQAEILELKEEVAFYRSIVSPKESAKGLRIQRFKIEPTPQPHRYRYKLVLTQVMKNDRYTHGTITMSVNGVQDAQPRTLPLADVAASGKPDLKFRFKYFQDFEDDLILPPDFVPDRVELKVAARGKNRADIRRMYRWPDVAH